MNFLSEFSFALINCTDWVFQDVNITSMVITTKPGAIVVYYMASSKNLKYREFNTIICAVICGLNNVEIIEYTNESMLRSYYDYNDQNMTESMRIAIYKIFKTADLRCHMGHIKLAAIN